MRLLAACAGLALLSTLLPWALAFDPEAWLVWGREALRLDLSTEGGPSWKPLPVLATAPLSLLGDGAPWAWLVVARTGGLLALAGAWRLALRLGGRGWAAAALVALSPWWLFNTALGNSEGLLAAAVLWAALAHLEGRHRAALVLALAAALLRPEAWPFLGVYAAWLVRERLERPAVVAAFLLAVPVAWCVPELLSSGEPFRAADAALGTPSAEAAANADVPGLQVLLDAAELATIPVTLLFLLATAPRNASWERTTSRTRRALGLAALGWVALVAIMAQAGFAGTPRYSVPAAAMAAVLAVTVTRRSAVTVGLVALVAALQLGPLREQIEDVGRRVDLRQQTRENPCGAPPHGVTTAAWFADVPIREAAACRR